MCRLRLNESSYSSMMVFCVNKSTRSFYRSSFILLDGEHQTDPENVSQRWLQAPNFSFGPSHNSCHWTEWKMSFSDTVQSLKTGKRLFLRAGQGSVESLHHFPSHQLSQQKKFSFQLRLQRKCRDNWHKSGHGSILHTPQRKGLQCMTSKKLALILTHQGKLSHNHMRL